MKKAFAIVYRDTNEIFQVKLRNAGLIPLSLIAFLTPKKNATM